MNHPNCEAEEGLDRVKALKCIKPKSGNHLQCSLSLQTLKNTYSLENPQSVNFIMFLGLPEKLPFLRPVDTESCLRSNFIGHLI